MTRTNDFIRAANPMRLEVNQDKTKYLVMNRGTRDHSHLVVGNYSFQQVVNFKYLWANINNQNNMHNEIKLRISAANKGYYALGKLFKSKLLSRQSKERLYSSCLPRQCWINMVNDDLNKCSQGKYDREQHRQSYGKM